MLKSGFKSSNSFIMKKTTIILSCIACLLAWNACNITSEKKAASDAWVTYSSKDGVVLFGEKIEFEYLKPMLYDSLTKMQELPTTIPIHYEGEVLMGMRGEVETDVNDALKTAVARKACEQTIHGFYTWYDAFRKDDSRNLNFTDDKGKHLKLDAAKLDTYLGHFMASGFVGTGFIEGRKTFYKNCEKLWQNEPKDEPPSCLDYDPIFCAQDWDLDFWTKAPVFIDLYGDTVAATLRSTVTDNPQEHDFDLVLENGKWVLLKIECGEEEGQ